MDWPTIILVGTLVAFIVMLIGGLTNSFVVFFDKKDFVISFMPYVCVGMAPLLHGMEMISYNVAVGIASMAGLFVIWAVVISVKHNGVIVGLIIGILKIIAALVGAVIFALSIGKMFDKDSDKATAVLFAVFSMAFVWFGSKLINGQEVYEKKGWELPREE